MSAATSDRLAVHLGAEVKLSRDSAWPCQVLEVGLREVVARGVDPARQSPDDGALVNLQFVLPSGGTRVQTPAQVVAADGEQVKLAFDMPEHYVVKALNDWAYNSSQAAGQTSDAFDPRRAHEVLEACKLATLRHLEDRLPQVPSSAKDTLFERAHSASSNTEQAEFFDAMQEVERVMPSVTTGFTNGLQASFRQLWSGNESDTEVRETSADELSLIDTGSFNDWLLTVQIIDRCRSKIGRQEAALLDRVGQLLGRAVDSHELSFGLEAVCSVFHDALQNLGAGRRTRQALLVAFEVNVATGLNELHTELGGLLDKSGVPAPSKTATKTAAATGSSATAAGPANTQPSTPEPTRQSAPEEPHHSPQGRVPVPAPQPDAYDTTKTLAELRRGADDATLATRPSQGDPGAPGNGNTQRLITGLAELDEHDWQQWQGGEPLRMAARADELFARQQLQADADTRDVLELVSDLVDTMLQDPLVHPDIRTRLGRLALPLARTALAGDPFFARPSHPARQLLDGMGTLQPPLAPDSAAWLQHLDELIEPVVDATVPTTREYARAFERVTPLVSERHHQLVQAIAEVEAASTAQQAAIGQLKQTRDEVEENSYSRLVTHPAAWKQWLAKTTQLKAGEVVVFDHDHKGARPATLAWITDDRKTFAFVDHGALSHIVLTQHELAMDLRRGQISAVEGSTLALTERALCKQLHNLHDTVQRKATSDPVTDLVNRRHFEAAVARALRDANPAFDPDGLCLIQVDEFEQIAHACGRGPAKQLLKKLAGMLERLIGDSGLVCRVKDHRFGVLVTDCAAADMMHLFKRYARAVEEARCVYKGKPFPMTVSMGLAQLETELKDTAAAFKAAGHALQEAVTAGGNRLELYQADTRMDTDGEPAVRELIEAGRLGLRAQRVQPIDPESGLLPYYEVLLGVRDHQQCLLPPGSVIAAAERRGEIFELDQWVIRETFTWMMGGEERLQQVAGYAINLSGLSLSDQRLLPYVLELLTELRVPTDKVIFEVTETAAIDQLSVAQAFIHTLQDRGCGFSLDDFGVGHGSFAYLRNLPVDKIKIDGMFVKDLCDNANDRAVVKSINEIARFMERITVAEFVENDDIMAVLRELGVDYAQGYGVEKPRPILELG